jgi:hypothetical protein
MSHFFWRRSSHRLARLMVCGVLLATGATEFPVRAVDNLVPEGDFSEPKGGFANGWKLGGCLGRRPETGEMYENKITLEADADGMPFARIVVGDKVCTHVGFANADPIMLDPSWKGLHVSFKARLKNFQQGREPWNDFRMFLRFKDEEGNNLTKNDFLHLSEDKDDWVTLEKSFTIPDGAFSTTLSFEMLGCWGEADVAKVSLTPDM